MATSISERDYSIAFWFFAVVTMIPAICLFRIGTPKPRVSENKEQTTTKCGFNYDVGVVFMASMTLGVYVGGELGFGSYVLVYAKW